MARGWESKSVEEQQAEAAASASQVKTALTPKQVARQRQEVGLQLSRQHVLQQLQTARHPRHRQMLTEALADLEARLRDLG